MKVKSIIVIISLIISGFINAQKIQNSDSIHLKEIIVYGVKGGDAKSGYRNDNIQLGLLGEVKLIDAPYSVHVISSKLIENTGSHTLGDALRTNPTASIPQTPSNDGRGLSEVSIRGFDPTYMQNGMILNTYIPMPVEDVERIEIFNGFSSFFNGFQNLGGTVNFVTKQPTRIPIVAFSLGQYKGGIDYIHADLGGSIDLNKRLTYRFNAYTEDGTSFVENSKQRNTNFYGALSYQIVKKTYLKSNFSHHDFNMQGQQTLFIIDPTKGINVPDANQFDARKLYGQPWTYTKGSQDRVEVSLESKINNIFSFRSAYSYTDISRKNNGVTSTFTDNDGNYKQSYSDGNQSSAYINNFYAFMDANFLTWKIKHDLSFGYMENDFIQQNNPKSLKNIALKHSNSSNAPSSIFNIFSPTYVAMPDTFALTPQTQKLQQSIKSGIVSDRIKINRFFMVFAGVNYSEYSYKNFNTETGIITADFTQKNFTPNVAVTFKPDSLVSGYASYMQGVVAGGFTTTPFAKNVNEVLDPSVSDQYEVGAKARLWNMDFTASLFNINKINEYLDPRDSVYKQDGREVHRGLEFTAKGKVFKGLTFVGGLTLLDAKITKAADNPAIEGKMPANVPTTQVSTYLEYDIPGMDGLNVSLGANYSSKRACDATNINFLPDYTIFDAGLRYQTDILRHNLTLNFNVSNLTNKTYWATYKPKGTVGMGLGAPRLMSLSLKYEL